MKVVIGTRGSKLALTQSRIVQARLQKTEPHLEVEVRVIHTKGDKILDSSLAYIDDKGLFVKEIEIALLDKTIDIAVHSMKDLPTDQPEGLQVAAVPEREVPNEAFASKKFSALSALKPGCIVGTSSLRRRSQLLHLQPDLTVKDIRGNLDTRLRKLDEGEYDGLLLAAAGLNRLGLGGRITELLPLDVMIPAVGQGALAVETRKDDETTFLLCQSLNHPETQRAVEEERDFLKALGGGCQVPLGCHAHFDGGEFRISGFIGDLEGKEKVSRTLKKPREDYRGSGRKLAALLLEEGGEPILEKIRK